MSYPFHTQIDLWKRIQAQNWKQVQVIADLLKVDAHSTVVKRNHNEFTTYEVIFKAGKFDYCYHFVYLNDKLIFACTDTENNENKCLRKRGYVK